MLGRRQPTILQPDDPKYQYMVGVLVGAAEMMASYMKLHGDEKAQGMAARVDLVLESFVPLTDDQIAVRQLQNDD